MTKGHAQLMPAEKALRDAELAADRYDRLGAPMTFYQPHVAEMRRRAGLPVDANAVFEQAEAAIASVGKWEIDTSTDSPILTYEKCSVIQDEQAYYVLKLVRADAALSEREGQNG